MRKRKRADARRDISILALDDDPVMTLTIQSYFTNSTLFLTDFRFLSL